MTESLFHGLEKVEDDTKVLVADLHREHETRFWQERRIGLLLMGERARRVKVLDSLTLGYLCGKETATPPPLPQRRARFSVDAPAPAVVGGWQTGPTVYLGTPEVHWLREIDTPMCISYSRLRGRKSLPRARGPWILDSSGFMMLQQNGTWTVSPAEYVEAVARYQREIGNLQWAAAQDWMCEQAVIEGGRFKGDDFVGTGLSVGEHLRRTVDNFVELVELWPRYSDGPCPFRPTVQGYDLADYLECWDLYERAGVDLTGFDTVAIGSVCRREKTHEISFILSELSKRAALPWHGFGVKTGGLLLYSHLLKSIDSQAWSAGARRSAPLAGCRHKACANCQRYALLWYAHLQRIVRRQARQYALGDVGVEQELLASLRGQ